MKFTFFVRFRNAINDESRSCILISHHQELIIRFLSQITTHYFFTFKIKICNKLYLSENSSCVLNPIIHLLSEVSSDWGNNLISHELSLM